LDVVLFSSSEAALMTTLFLPLTFGGCQVYLSDFLLGGSMKAEVGIFGMALPKEGARVLKNERLSPQDADTFAL
jgi:hypothetical protein